MKKKTKKILVEIVVIAGIASVFGIFNNLIADKPLAFIKKPVKIEAVEDSEIFGSGEKSGTEKLNKSVSYEQVLKMLDKPEVQFIDARSPDVYAEGTIGNAINIYPENENELEFFEQINNLQIENAIYIVFCDGGFCDLSHKVITTMLDFGYEHAWLYNGGWEDWQKNQGLDS